MFRVSFVFLLLAAALLQVSLAQEEDETFEPADFNATQALLDHGFDPAALPDTADVAERSAGWACKAACLSLRVFFGDDRVLTNDEPEYDDFTGSYWAAQQGNVNPACIFKPPNRIAVAEAVLLSRLTRCPFAARSGGHAAFAGASSIEGGITISFADMKDIKVSHDKKTASVEPGNVWGTLYQHLEDYEVAAIGGRVFSIGVGGLTLGGGISFFSGLHGWAGDNVAKYTVVMANGRIVEATPTHRQDLYWALRGGGNNFGLVVNFDLNLYPLPENKMWGGTRIYTEDSFAGVVDGFTKVLVDAPEDGNAGQWVAWVYSNNTKIASAEFWYAKPVADAPIFSGYDSVTPLSDTTEVRTLASYAAELQKTNPDGFREVYYGLTVKVDRDLLAKAKDIFYEEVLAVADVQGALPTMITQGITVPIMKAMEKNGGNPLGLSASDGPFYIIHIACWWQNEADDARIYEFVSKVLTRIKEEAASRDLANDYIYMNYASTFEDVISSYGSENKQRLKHIARKYDPTAIFQTLQPGYFKLDHAPTPDSPYFSG